MKNKHLVKTYTLSDGQEVTCRQVADEIQISESAARYRLIRTDDPKKVFAPYLRSNGGQRRKVDRDANVGTKKNKAHIATEEEKLWKLVMQMGKKND